MVDSPQVPVSVVTPVHNGAQYLAECIESVLGQTHQNWEYVIVDNCSQDDSVEIARRYAVKDARIRVQTNQEFLRAIPNHNRALRQISPESKYCKVVFADDWMFPECLEKMLAIAQQHSSIGIVSAYSLDGQRILWAGLPYPSTVVSGRDLCRKLFLEDLRVLGSATAMLYRADLVRNRDPFYCESGLHGDTETHVALLGNCDFGFVHQVLTFTRARQQSLSAISTELNTHIAGNLHTLATCHRQKRLYSLLDWRTRSMQ